MLVKCQYCGIKDTDKTEMIKENKGYYHQNCHYQAEEELKFKQIEYQEKCELTDTIVRIHDFQSRQAIPPAFYSRYLEPYRNDNKVREKINKRYKAGFDYKTIRETYLFKEEEILKYLKLKRDQGAFKDTLGELIYVFKGIVQNNIENLLRDIKRKEKAVQNKEKVIESMKVMNEVNQKLKRKREEQKSNKFQNEESFDIMSLVDEYDE